MNEVGKIALGVAAGLVLFCGGGLFLASASCANAAARTRETNRQRIAEIEQGMKRRERERAKRNADRPELGKTGLARPIELFMDREWNFVPDPLDVDAGVLLDDAKGGYWQSATFDHQGKRTAWEFTIREGAVIAKEIP